MADRPPFLRTPPVHFHFLRTIDELEASAPPEPDKFADKPLISLPYDEERHASHRRHPDGGQAA
jgi:hypothetical protein